MTDTETTTETPEKDDQLAERHGYVDFDKIEDPEVRKQVQDRIHGLYQSQKDTAAAFNEAQRMYTTMEKRLGEMEAKSQKEETASKLDQTRAKMVEANSKGDYETVAKLNEQLIDLKTPVQQPTRDDALEDRNTQILMAWQSEMTDDGRMARPWAHKTHRAYNETIAQLGQVTDDPEFSGKGFKAILAEVDRRMTPKPKQAAPVSNGDTTPSRPSTRTPQLTEGMKKAAIRLYPQMKPADAIKRYAEAKTKYGDD